MVKPRGTNSRGNGHLSARTDKRKGQSYLNLGGGYSRVGPGLLDQGYGPGTTTKAGPAGRSRGVNAIPPFS